jgi:hypothetical protein
LLDSILVVLPQEIRHEKTILYNFYIVIFIFSIV